MRRAHCQQTPLVGDNVQQAVQCEHPHGHAEAVGPVAGGERDKEVEGREYVDVGVRAGRDNVGEVDDWLVAVAPDQAHRHQYDEE